MRYCGSKRLPVQRREPPRRRLFPKVTGALAVTATATPKAEALAYGLATGARVDAEMLVHNTNSVVVGTGDTTDCHGNETTN